MPRSLLCSLFALSSALFFQHPSVLHGERESGPDDGLRVAVDGGVLRIQPLDVRAMRVTFFPDGVTSISDGPVLLQTGICPDCSIESAENTQTIRTDAMSASVDVESGRVSFYDADGKLLLSERPASRVVRASSVGGEPCHEVGQSFDTQPGEHLYGTGQFQDGELVLNGLPRRLVQINTQIAIPFVLSSRGYGLLWNNTGMSDFNMAGAKCVLDDHGETGVVRDVWDWDDGVSSIMKRNESEYAFSYTAVSDGRYGLLLLPGPERRSSAEIYVDGRELLTQPGSTFVELSAGEHHFRILAQGGLPEVYLRDVPDAFSFSSPVAEALDYVVFAGPDPDDAIAAYRRCTGSAPILPIWAYGFIQCRERYENQQQLVDAVDGYRSRGIPMDLVVQDWLYWGKHGWNAMQFDEDNYPDPAGMVKAVHQKDAHIMISVWSKIGLDTELGKWFSVHGWFIPGTHWVDFFNPDAAHAYWSSIDRNFASIGIDAWWLDATEPEDNALTGTTTFAGPGDRFMDMYPLLVSKTVYEGQRERYPQNRVLILTRSAFAGQQRYASTVWSGDIHGDWDTFRRQIPAGLNYVACGLPYWTTDCGGFVRPDDQYESDDYHELFLRWLQFATFCPLMRVHGLSSHTEVWNYGSYVEEQSARWIRLRYSLLPYIYSMASMVTYRGDSLMRPLVMAFPDDAEALERKYEFMFGSSILAAPVVEAGAVERTVYFPKYAPGWTDFFTGKRHEGGRSEVVPAPLESMPLYVRSGSIVPLLLTDQQDTADMPAGGLEIRIYPGADASASLYFDDGRTYSYEQGLCSTVRMRWMDAEKLLKIDARDGVFPQMQKTRPLKVVLVGEGGWQSRTLQYMGSSVYVDFSQEAR